MVRENPESVDQSRDECLAATEPQVMFIEYNYTRN